MVEFQTLGSRWGLFIMQMINILDENTCTKHQYSGLSNLGNWNTGTQIACISRNFVQGLEPK